MQVLFALKGDIDIQQDAYLRTGAVLAAPGPDRAYLHYMGRDAQGRECGRCGRE